MACWMQCFFRTQNHSDFAAVSVENIRDAAHHADLGGWNRPKKSELDQFDSDFFVGRMWGYNSPTR